MAITYKKGDKFIANINFSDFEKGDITIITKEPYEMYALFVKCKPDRYFYMKEMSQLIEDGVFTQIEIKIKKYNYDDNLPISLDNIPPVIQELLNSFKLKASKKSKKNIL